MKSGRNTDYNNYHADEKERIEGIRYAGIVAKNDKVLLIYREKKGHKYYVFPGGHGRRNEKPKNTVIREIKEETNEKPKLIFEYHDHFNKSSDFYYLCQWQKGSKPELTGEEKIRNSKNNFCKPLWIELDKLANLNILPVFAKDWLMNNTAKIKQ